MSEYPYTTGDLADEFNVARQTILKKANALHLGIDIGGRAGFRYSEADRRQLIESMKPAAPLPKRRRRPRATSAAPAKAPALSRHDARAS